MGIIRAIFGNSNRSESLKMIDIADLHQVILSCKELQNLSKRLISAQDQWMIEINPANQHAWVSATESFYKHLVEHHGWSPKAQTDANVLMKSLNNLAKDLGL